MKFVIFLLIAATSLIAQTPHRGVVSIAGSKNGQVVNRCLGFIVEREGFVLTNYDNLTSQPDGRLLENFAVTSGSKIYGAEIIGVEPTINIAILKI